MSSKLLQLSSVAVSLQGGTNGHEPDTASKFLIHTDIYCSLNTIFCDDLLYSHRQIKVIHLIISFKIFSKAYKYYFTFPVSKYYLSLFKCKKHSSLCSSIFLLVISLSRESTPITLLKLLSQRSINILIIATSMVSVSFYPFDVHAAFDNWKSLHGWFP